MKHLVTILGVANIVVCESSKPRDSTMIFDALTIASLVSGVLSGGFVIATAATQAPRQSVHRRSSGPLETGARSRRRAAHARLRRTPSMA